MRTLKSTVSILVLIGSFFCAPAYGQGLPELTAVERRGMYSDLAIKHMALSELTKAVDFLLSITPSRSLYNKDPLQKITGQLPLLAKIANLNQSGNYNLPGLIEFESRQKGQLNQDDAKFLAGIIQIFKVETYLPIWLGPLIIRKTSDTFLQSPSNLSFDDMLTDYRNVQNSLAKILDVRVFQLGPGQEFFCRNGESVCERAASTMKYPVYNIRKAVPSRKGPFTAEADDFGRYGPEEKRLRLEALASELPTLRRVAASYPKIAQRASVAVNVAIQPLYTPVETQDYGTLAKLIKESIEDVSQPYPKLLEEFLKVVEAQILIQFAYGPMIEQYREIPKLVAGAVFRKKFTEAEHIALMDFIAKLEEQVQFDLGKLKAPQR